LELGAFDYIKKPFDEIEVIARVQSALRLEKLQRKLKELAIKDGLTGLYNHTLLIELLEKEIEKQQRVKGNIACVMLDIDYFKNINDAYGHIAGNMLLKEFASILRDSLRKGDIIARYGGDEFCAVLPGTSLQGAAQLCKRFRDKVQNYEFKVENKTIRITVSIGVSSIDYADNIIAKEIIKEADQNLYKAKQNGRNRIEMDIIKYS